ncbi:MAG: flagellar hook-basal body protein FliE [Alphaproteobacteria bacterium]|nr:flagellar hook-basal body protein FliE [Alphaproteobacteria bacterium]
MAIDTLGVSQAYAATKRLNAPEGSDPASVRSGSRPDATTGANGFANAASSVALAVSEGERAASKLVVGQADPHSVIEALAVAELAVETAVTVRDKVVEAYQEILRMPV